MNAWDNLSVDVDRGGRAEAAAALTRAAVGALGARGAAREAADVDELPEADCRGDAGARAGAYGAERRLAGSGGREIGIRTADLRRAVRVRAASAASACGCAMSVRADVADAVAGGHAAVRGASQAEAVGPALGRAAVRVLRAGAGASDTADGVALRAHRHRAGRSLRDDVHAVAARVGLQSGRARAGAHGVVDHERIRRGAAGHTGAVLAEVPLGRTGLAAGGGAARAARSVGGVRPVLGAVADAGAVQPVGCVREHALTAGDADGAVERRPCQVDAAARLALLATGARRLGDRGVNPRRRPDQERHRRAHRVHHQVLEVAGLVVIKALELRGRVAEGQDLLVDLARPRARRRQRLGGERLDHRLDVVAVPLQELPPPPGPSQDGDHVLVVIEGEVVPRLVLRLDDLRPRDATVVLPGLGTPPERRPDVVGRDRVADRVQRPAQ